MVEYDMRVLQPSRLLALLQALDAALPQPHNMVGLFLFGGGGEMLASTGMWYWCIMM